MSFMKLCTDFGTPIHDLSDWKLADLLITGELARRSDGSGPRCSVALKAIRWCCRQLNVAAFECAFSPVVNSFEKQKIPYDRKEALPLPLYIFDALGKTHFAVSIHVERNSHSRRLIAHAVVRTSFF